VEYLELDKLDGEALLVEGWQRNAAGGLTRIVAAKGIEQRAATKLDGKASTGFALPEEPPTKARKSEPGCGSCRERRLQSEAAELPAVQRGGNKTTGIMSMLRAKTGDKVSPHMQQMRLAVCKNCKETKTGTEERLFRQIDDGIYCGEPRSLLHPSSIIRSESDDGCGCELNDKTQWWKAACPRDLWGEGPNIGSSAAIISRKERAKILEGVIDIRIRTVGAGEYTGIGDYLSAIPIVHAVAIAHDKRVRFRVVASKAEWAQLGWPDISLDHEDTDIGEKVLDLNAHTSTGLDILLEKEGLTRQDYWFKLAGVPSFHPKIDIQEDARAWVDEQLVGPRQKGQKIVVISAFANVPTRQWPVHHWIELVDALNARGYYVAAIDGEAQRGRFIQAKRYWGWKPANIAALVNAADLFIGCDSGMTHLAGLLERPTIALCAPTSGYTVFGWYENMHAIQSDASCTKCLWRRERGFRRSCGVECEALWRISPQQVSEQCEQVLAATS